MIENIVNHQQLQRQTDLLIAQTPIFGEALRLTKGYPPIRSGKAGFVGLAEIVASQQISKAAARSILARFWHTVENANETRSNDMATAYLNLSYDQKKSCGLSRPKIRYLDGIAEACCSGEIDPDHLAKLDDDALIKTLTRLSGIGLWSAEIYALFVLGRPNIMPAGDLALQESAKRLLGLPERPNEKTFRTISNQWAPYRSAAARLLFHYYRGAPIEG